MILFLPLTAIYFFGILIKNYSVAADSLINVSTWIFSGVALVAIVSSYIFRIFHWPFGGIFAVVSLFTVIALCLLLLFQLFKSARTKESFDVTSFCLLALPVIYISFRYLPISSSEDSKFHHLLQRIEVENEKASSLLFDQENDTSLIAIENQVKEIREIKAELISMNGGLEENGKIKGGNNKTVAEVLLIGPEGAERGKGYILFSNIKAHLPQLLGKEIPEEKSEFINSYFTKKTVLEAMYELNHLEHLILLHGLEKKLNPPLN